MSRRPLYVTIAAAAVFVGSVAFPGSSGAAIDQDLMVSLVAGPPGTVVEVSSASCIDDDVTGAFRLLRVRLVSGSAPNEVLAGAGSSFGGEPVKVIVPDWVDADADASIEAECIELVVTRDGAVPTTVGYTPVAFDVEPGVDAPVQTRTLSRSTMKAGQAFQDSFGGCTLAGASYLGSEVYGGSDLSGRNLGAYVAGGDGVVVDGAVDVALTNGTYSVIISQSGDEPAKIEQVEETPTNIAAGTYTSYGYCSNEDGDLLMFEPTTIEVTGDAPFASIDLTQPDAHARSVTLEGQGCTAGPVDAAVFETSLAEIQAGSSGDDDAGLQAAPKPDAALASSSDMASLMSHQTGIEMPGVASRSNAQLTGSAATSVGGGERATLASGVLTPDADGNWAGVADLDFDNGLAEGVAICGDPLAAGFYYDPQVLVVAVSSAPPTPTPTTAVPVRQSVNPTPANAVNGSPSYTG